jgi:hypothetical protein
MKIMPEDFERSDTSSKVVGALVAGSMLGSACTSTMQAPKSAAEEFTAPSIPPEVQVVPNPEVLSVEQSQTQIEPVKTVEGKEIDINEYVNEILDSMPELEFNDSGELMFKNSSGELVPIPLYETERYKSFPYLKMQEVKFFVIHYDGAPGVFANGKKGTVFNTLNGLNDPARLPSVQFLVDSFPVTDKKEGDNGMGILLAQRQSNDPKLPYAGKHVTVGYDATGRPDLTRVGTVDLYKKFGINSDLIGFVDSGKRNFDAYALGVEQSGNHDVFSMRSEDKFPPTQEIANTLALCQSVSKHHDLSIWDIVGHDEIQEKSDPGDEYMLTMRFLLGLLYMEDSSKFPDNFLGGDTFEQFIVKLKNYSIARMGQERYDKWNNKFGMDELIGDGSVEVFKMETPQDLSLPN